jgi:L-threonylcarbamoyladenylate synthase
VNKIIKKFEEMRDFLSKGYVVAYPTESTYGLGADPYNSESVDLLKKIKHRDGDKAFIVLIKDFDMLKRVAETNNDITNFLEKIWPGPVSVILKAKKTFPDCAKDAKGNLCLRLSPARFVKEFYEYYDRPVISTSANPSGYPAAMDELEVLSYFRTEEKIRVAADIYKDVGKFKPSTIIDISGNEPKILRQGSFHISF